MDVSAGCLCGGIRFRFVGEPLAFYQCHCTDCQIQTGSAFGLSLVASAEHVALVSGNPKAFRISMPDGRIKSGRFCSNCAARVWGEPVRWPQIRVLRPGTFDQLLPFAPFGDIWTASAQPWVAFTQGPQFPGQPEDDGALVKAWRTRAMG